MSINHRISARSGKSRRQRRSRSRKSQRHSVLEMFPTKAERHELERKQAMENEQAVRRAEITAQLTAIGHLLQSSAGPGDVEAVDCGIQVAMILMIREMFEPNRLLPRAELGVMVKELALAHRVVLDSERHRARRDQLDVDGKKFQAALKCLVGVFERTLEKMLFDRDLQHAAKLMLRDLLAEADADLRRAVARA